MRLRYLNNLIILSDDNFIDRLINNRGRIGHHGPIVHTSLSFIKMIYLIITGFRSYWIDCDCGETLIYRPDQLEPAVGFQLSEALPGLGASTCALMKHKPCLSTRRIL